MSKASKCTKVILNQKAVNDVCLSSKEITDYMLQLGNKKASAMGLNAKVYAVEHYGVRSNRSRVFVDTAYEEASKDNKLLKAIR